MFESCVTDARRIETGVLVEVCMVGIDWFCESSIDAELRVGILVGREVSNSSFRDENRLNVAIE